MLTTVRLALPVLALSLVLTGTAACAAESISKVNGGITVDADRSVGDVSTVNGGVTLEDRVHADEVENVNGGIELGDSVTVKRVSSVNGGVRAGKNLVLKNDLESVNGGVRLGPGAQVGGDLTAVNGGVKLDGVHIEGKVEIASGIVDTGRGSRLDGGIHVSPSSGHDNGWKKNKPRLIIGPDSVVGDIVMERETELFVHSSAKVGRISGGSAMSYSGDAP